MDGLPQMVKQLPYYTKTQIKLAQEISDANEEMLYWKKLILEISFLLSPTIEELIKVLQIK